jgi:hypothetical protein
MTQIKSEEKKMEDVEEGIERKLLKGEERKQKGSIKEGEERGLKGDGKGVNGKR